MTEPRDPLINTEGKPVDTPQRHYWRERSVYLNLGVVTVIAIGVLLTTLPRVPVAVPVVHNADEWSEHVDWSTLFVSQNLVGSALALAFLFGVWVPFLMRSLRALEVLGSSIVLGWLCAGAFFASATNHRLGDILSALVTWPGVSLDLSAPSLFLCVGSRRAGLLPWQRHRKPHSPTAADVEAAYVGKPAGIRRFAQWSAATRRSVMQRNCHRGHRRVLDSTQATNRW